MSKPVRITDEQRRARLVTRHRLTRSASDPVAATEAMVALHSSDPVTPFLGLWARVEGFEIADLERALYDVRDLWRLHAMRRTLWIVPAVDAGMFLSAVGDDVAARERRRVEQWLEAPGGDDLAPWISRIESEVVTALDGAQLSTSELAERVPQLAMEFEVGSGKWTATVPLSSRLLYLLAMDARIVRGRPAGTWRSSQYRWAAVSDGFGAVPDKPEPSTARRELVRRYLTAFGPVTETDVRWWSKLAARQVRAAFAELEVVTVQLDSGGTGVVLPDDVDGEEDVPPHVSFLPALDPTPMGWKDRAWYVTHGEREIFDTNGNIGPTIWVDGWLVGAWAHRPDGTIATDTVVEVDQATLERIAEEAVRLERWFDGELITPRFKTPLARRLSERE